MPAHRARSGAARPSVTRHESAKTTLDPSTIAVCLDWGFTDGRLWSEQTRRDEGEGKPQAALPPRPGSDQVVLAAVTDTGTVNVAPWQLSLAALLIETAPVKVTSTVVLAATVLVRLC